MSIELLQENMKSLTPVLLSIKRELEKEVDKLPIEQACIELEKELIIIVKKEFQEIDTSFISREKTQGLLSYRDNLLNLAAFVAVIKSAGDTKI